MKSNAHSMAEKTFEFYNTTFFADVAMSHLFQGFQTFCVLFFSFLLTLNWVELDCYKMIELNNTAHQAKFYKYL